MYTAVKSSYMIQSTGTQTIDRASRRRRQRHHSSHHHDNMKGMKVNEIEIVESLSNEPEPYPRRTAKTNIIPTDTVNSAYGDYISDALGNFVFLPKTAKHDFKVKPLAAPDWSGGADLLAARKLPTVSALRGDDGQQNEEMWETYEFVDHPPKSARRRSKRPKSEKTRKRVVKYETETTGEGIFSRSVPIVSASGGKKSVSLVLNDANKQQSRQLNKQNEESLYNKFPHVYGLGQTKVPQRHVDVTLMNERVNKETNYRGPYGLNSAEYLRKNKYVENFEHQ